MDNITLQRIAVMHPKVRGRLFDTYKEANDVLGTECRLRFSYTFRTPEEQHKLFLQKPKVTNADSWQSIHNYGLACFSDDTKIVTNNGIKYFYELSPDDMVLTFNNGNVEFQYPKSYISNDYKGEMIKIKTRSVDLLVTPNHKMIVKKRGKNKWTSEWSSIDAIDVSSRHKIPTSGITTNKGVYMPDIKFEKRVIDISDTKNFYYFLGIWISDGSIAGAKSMTKRTHSSRYAIKISQSKEKNTDIWNKINSCLKKMNINYSYIGHDFVFHNKALWEYLFTIGNTYTKYIPKEILNSNYEHLVELYSGLIDGDGSRYNNGDAYFSVSKKLIDSFCSLSLLIGKSCCFYSKKQKPDSIMPHGEVIKSEPKLQYTVRNRINASNELRNGDSSSRITREIYSGIVYCVETNAGAVFVERNGKISVSGNCDIVLLYDKDNDGNFEEVSWDMKRDGDRDGIADWIEVTRIFVNAGWTNGFITNGKKWDFPHFQKDFGLSWRDMKRKIDKGDYFTEKINGYTYKYINI